MKIDLKNVSSFPAPDQIYTKLKRHFPGHKIYMRSKKIFIMGSSSAWCDVSLHKKAKTIYVRRLFAHPKSLSYVLGILLMLTFFIYLLTSFVNMYAVVFGISTSILLIVTIPLSIIQSIVGFNKRKKFQEEVVDLIKKIYL